MTLIIAGSEVKCTQSDCRGQRSNHMHTFNAQDGNKKCFYFGPQNYCKPQLVGEESVFDVRGGFHPVVASQQQSTFVGNNCCMDRQQRVWIITGPNMGGKDHQGS